MDIDKKKEEETKGDVSPAEVKTTEETTAVKNRSKTVIIALAVLVVALLVAGGVFAGLVISGTLSFDGQQTTPGPAVQTPSSGVAPTHSSGLDLQIDPSAGEYVQPAATPTMTPGTTLKIPSVHFPGYSTITIPARMTEVGVNFYNPEANKGRYYLTFELGLKDTGEVLYQSGLVEPGKQIQKIHLSRGLDRGTYDAYVLMKPYTMDENRRQGNNGVVNIKLEVE